MREIGGPQLDLRLYSFIDESETLSEEKWIDLVGAASGGEVRKVRLRPEDIATRLPTLTALHDEPLGGTSVMAQYAVFRQASRDGVKVMLDGQGADETLAGYKLYLGARLASLLRQGKWSEAMSFYRRCRREPGTSWKSLLALTADHLLPSRWQRQARRMIGREVVSTWMDEQWFLDQGVRSSGMNYVTGSDALRARMLRSIETSLPHLLRYEDRNSMAFSIESRVPFLTPQLVSFLVRLPESYLVSSEGETKSVFRRRHAWNCTRSDPRSAG